MSINRVIIEGRLTRDPEMRVTPSGMQITQFGIANDVVRVKNGSREKEGHFFDIKAFGKQAEFASKHFTKGKSIIIEGTLRQERWEGSDGKKNSRVGIVVDQFHFTNSNSEKKPYKDSGDDWEGDGGNQKQKPSQGAGSGVPDDIDEEPPF